MNALECFSRALLVGVIPLLAFEALGSKEAVTLAYLFASLLTLTITLNFARLERMIKRRWVVTLGGIFSILAATIFMFSTGYGLSLAIGLQKAAGSMFAICLSLYIMDYINRHDLIATESRRIFYSGIAWIAGPTLGIWLWNETGHWAPFILTMLSSAIALAYFWFLRLGENEVIQPARSISVSPLILIPRYFVQPTLRIAYLITLTRSIFWLSLFIYGPIYVVEAGLPTWMAGGLISLTSGLMLCSSLIRNLASRYGTRKVIIVAQNTCAAALVMLFFTGDPKPVGMIYWVLASVGAASLDVVGNIPFMRLVKTRERTEMTMIFSTWREASNLLTPLLVTLILLVAPIETFYLLLALMLTMASVAVSYLPRRL
ncbi:MAG: ACDE family multidrug resistance protein [Gammaproteobacteria bacterium]|jgi:ACDE family multidrug resistance protein